MIEVGLLKVNPVAALAPKLTVAPVENPVPVMVTVARSRLARCSGYSGDGGRAGAQHEAPVTVGARGTAGPPRRGTRAVCACHRVRPRSEAVG